MTDGSTAARSEQRRPCPGAHRCSPIGHRRNGAGAATAGIAGPLLLREVLMGPAWATPASSREDGSRLSRIPSTSRPRVVGDQLRASALTTKVRALCGAAAVAPSALLLAADPGAVAAFGFEEPGVAGMGVAPPDVSPKSLAERRMVGVVAVGENELAQRPKMSLDRVRP